MRTKRDKVIQIIDKIIMNEDGNNDTYSGYDINLDVAKSMIDTDMYIQLCNDREYDTIIELYTRALGQNFNLYLCGLDDWQDTLKEDINLPIHNRLKWQETLHKGYNKAFKGANNGF